MTASTTPAPVKTVLLTGFDPFNGATINPSWEAVRALDGWSGPGFAVVARQLPCVFGTALDVLRESIAGVKPDIVIAVGQAGGRSEMSLERVAINVDDASIRDNAGNQPVDTPIAADGPAAYFTTLPVKAIVKALRLRGFPSGVSQTAGTFVCNHVFYGLMHDLATRTELQHTRGGLIHLPWVPAQGQPSMRLDETVEGLKVAIECALATVTDIRLEAGALN